MQTSGTTYSSVNIMQREEKQAIGLGGFCPGHLGPDGAAQQWAGVHSSNPFLCLWTGIHLFFSAHRNFSA